MREYSTMRVIKILIGIFKRATKKISAILYLAYKIHTKLFLGYQKS